MELCCAMTRLRSRMFLRSSLRAHRELSACRFRHRLPSAIRDLRFAIRDSPLAFPVRPLERLRKDEGKRIGEEPSVSGPAPSTVSRWFAAIGSLNRWATSLQELYTQAARCTVEAIGLDGAMLLRRRDDRWEIAASHLPNPELGIQCDLHVLEELLQSSETLFHGSASPLQRADGPNPSRRSLSRRCETPPTNSSAQSTATARFARGTPAVEFATWKRT